MPILELQKRARELGRIRLGQKGDRGQPQKLERFRFTSPSKPLLEKVAALYGGQVTEWTPAGGSQQWEVVSDANRIPIMVPPQPVTQWFEFWTRAGCQHRCDGRTNVLTDELCDPEDPKHQEAIKKPTTRLSVVLRDVEGVGVWRCESHGWNAAVEIPDAAAFLAAVGGYVEGWLSLEQRTSVDNTGDRPQTRHFMVPIIEIDVTPAELMAGRGRVAPVELAGNSPVAAIGAGGTSDPLAPYFDEVAAATTQQQLTALWQRAMDAKVFGPGLPTPPRFEEFSKAVEARAAALKPAGGNQGEEAVGHTPEPAASSPAPDADGVYEAEVVLDADEVWAAIVKAGGDRGMTLPDLQDDFAQQMGGLTSDSASAEELDAYLKILTARPAA